MNRIFLSIGFLCVLAPGVFANSLGIKGYSGKLGFNCNVCHTPDGVAPTVEFSGPSQLAPNKQATFTFTVTSNAVSSQVAAGIDLAASGGTLTTINGQGEKQQMEEVSHSAPKNNDNNGVTTWMFTWKAPAAAGNYILYGSGNSVNLNATTSGDKAASTQFFVAVGNVTPLPSVTPTVLATATKTRTITVAPTATVTITSTSTALPSSTATTAATATITATPVAVATATPTPILSPTEASFATASPTASATNTVSVTSTASPTHTPTPTLTPSATPVRRGDANCDGVISAADVVEATLVLAQSQPDCGGADSNGDGVVTIDDVLTTAGLLYAE